jgi:NAD(P)-dependent dehydrogenase (short-subunit alcohol dehydrogenase family)
MDVEGKIAIVTGGSKGLGLGFAKALVKFGADVVICSRNEIEGQEAADELRKLGGRVMAVRCDVTIKSDVDRLIDATVRTFGRIDILVNNAGMNCRKMAEEYLEEEFDQVIRINLKGNFIMAQAVIPVMKQQKSGSIINISSILGEIGMMYQSAYASSKGAINQLTKVLALELAPYGVNVNAIAPTYIKTPMTSGWLSDEERFSKILENTPMGRVGELDDLVGPVVFFSSDAAKYITGQILCVDGGWVAR